MAGAALVVVWAGSVQTGWIVIASIAFGWALLALAVTDLRHGILPDSLTLLLLVGGLAEAGQCEPAQLAARFIGAVGGGSFFLCLALGYRRWRGRDGLGMGDAKLLAGLGAWVSWSGLPAVVFLGAAAALCTVAVRIASGHPVSRHDSLPFGPYLAFSGWLVWLYGSS